MLRYETQWPNVPLELVFASGTCHTQPLWIALTVRLLYYILRVTLHGMHRFLSERWTFFGGFSDFQLDQLVIDSAMEKREMEHKHATIQQRVSSYICFSQIDQIKTVWFYGTKCLNNGCRKLSEKVAKKFRLLASLDHFQLLLLRSFFYVSVSVQTSSPVYLHTLTHLTLPWIWEPLHACLSSIYLCDRKGLRPSGWFEVIYWLALAGWTPSGSMNQTGCERAHISPPGSQSATWPSASVVTGGGIRPGQLGSVWLIPSNKVQALI